MQVLLKQKYIEIFWKFREICWKRGQPSGFETIESLNIKLYYITHFFANIRLEYFNWLQDGLPINPAKEICILAAVSFKMSYFDTIGRQFN